MADAVTVDRTDVERSNARHPETTAHAAWRTIRSDDIDCS
jgi:hypothetical protein